MSLARDEVDDWCNDYRPLFPWQQDQSCPMDAGPEDAEASTGLAEPGPENMMPTVPGSFIDSKPMDIAVVTVAVGAAQVNSTESAEEYQALMHPDIAVSPMLSHLANFTAELETAWWGWEGGLGRGFIDALRNGLPGRGKTDRVLLWMIYSAGVKLLSPSQRKLLDFKVYW